MAFNRYTPQLPDLLRRQQTDPTFGNIGVAPTDTTYNTTYDNDSPIPQPSDLRQALTSPEIQQAPGKFMPDVNIPQGLPTPQTPKPSLVAPRTARDAYMSAVNTPPNEADYKPTKLTRLGATLSGIATGWNNPAAGPEVADKILSRGYDTAKSEYQDRLKNLATSANLEREENQDTFERQKFDVTSGHEERRMGQEDQRIKIAQDQLKLQGRHIITSSDGSTLVIDENGGKPINLGKFSLSDAEKKANAIEDEARKHSQAMELKRLEGTNAMNVAGVKNEGNAKVAEIRKSASLARVKDLADKGDTVANRVQDIAAIYNIDPDDYTSYNPTTKQWTVFPPSSPTLGFGGDSPLQSEIKTKLLEATRTGKSAPLKTAPKDDEYRDTTGKGSLVTSHESKLPAVKPFNPPLADRSAHIADVPPPNVKLVDAWEKQGNAWVPVSVAEGDLETGIKTGQLSRTKPGGK